jgi:hypothetical protein
MAGSLQPIDIERLRQLAAEKCHGTLTPAGLTELSALLARSSEARAEYWEIVMMHSNLNWELAGEAGCSDELARIVLDDLSLSCVAGGSSRASTNRVSAWGLAIAISLCVVALVGAWAYWGAADRRPPMAERQPSLDQSELAPILGRVCPLVPESRWSFGRPGRWNDDVMREGDTISLDEGELKLRLLNGTVAILKSPVVMQTVSLDRVRLLLGLIKVDVAKGAEGFSVETASAEVIDLGTVFSVGVERNGTDVIVFDGEVDLQFEEHSNDNGRTRRPISKRFQSGQAVHVSTDGTLSRIVNVNQAEFSFRGSQLSGTDPLIKVVRDNIARDDMWSFYEIVPSGLKEDAKAFVDRKHEWNGATTDGMPSYLLAADYVKTFADDKVTSDLTIELELQKPAAVYVFLDKRVAIPEWLIERFHNTGDEIGIDECYPSRHYPDRIRPSQVGAGEGIERTFSIWKLVAEESVVQLGPNGDISPQERLRGVNAESLMYGIAVVPLDRADLPR